MGGSIEMSLVGNIFKGLTIYSNITGNLEELTAVVQLAKEGKLSPVPVQKMAWDSVNEAMGLLKAGKVTGRMILVK
jgi:alcohol dehydrogenase/propanol-preferring alcohol dehydrogenase